MPDQLISLLQQEAFQCLERTVSIPEMRPSLSKLKRMFSLFCVVTVIAAGEWSLFIVKESIKPRTTFL